MVSKNMLYNTYSNYIINNPIEFTNKDNNCRIMTYNVKMFNNYNGVINVIIKSNADIIGLNEALFFNISKDKFINDITLLGYNIVMCNDKYGINILLSKYTINNYSIISLGKDNIKYTNRYALKANIGSLKILLTHLDPFDITENTRLKQINIIMKNIDDEYLIMGDLNCLRKSDYDINKYDAIVEIDRRRNILTKTIVTDFIEPKGFIDSFVKINKIPPTISVWSCRRIDYIYIGQLFPYKINNSIIIPTSASDHLPIYIDIII
jgi:endonuclease/exonuclease/phosphatase family metal-dependent hydrolase